MSIEKAKAYLRQFGAEDRVIEFPVSSATVELAAEAAHCEPARIAKTLSFRTNDGVILIVAAGDTKIDNPKYKARFGCKARMLAFEEVEPEIGHAVGGVCPFGVNDGITVYLDESLRRFETVFPACGSSNSAIEVTIRNWRNSPVSRPGWTSARAGERREHGCHRAVRRRGGQNCQSQGNRTPYTNGSGKWSKNAVFAGIQHVLRKSERTVEKYRGRRAV